MAQNATRPSAHAADPEIVDGYAQVALLTLRHNNIPTADILATYCKACPKADANFERTQRRNHGQVIAPAAAVRDRLRELVLASQN